MTKLTSAISKTSCRPGCPSTGTHRGRANVKQETESFALVVGDCGHEGRFQELGGLGLGRSPAPSTHGHVGADKLVGIVLNRKGTRFLSDRR
jgi:hypothetical protein